MIRYRSNRLGRPFQAMENVTVKGRRIGSDTIVKQDIGGWYCMPEDHFKRLMDRATRDRKAIPGP